MPNVTGMDLLKIAAANPDAVVPPEGLELLNGKQAKRNKFNAVKVDFDGMRFDSKAEMRRYGELRYMELAGQISRLEVHPKPPIKLGGGAKYYPDFRYVENGKTVIEDVKGGMATMTPVFRLKWRQAQELYPQYEWRIVTK